jgi:hypothetical protein
LLAGAGSGGGAIEEGKTQWVKYGSSLQPAHQPLHTSVWEQAKKYNGKGACLWATKKCLWARPKVELLCVSKELKTVNLSKFYRLGLFMG